MDMASFLRRFANVLVAANIVKLVAGDLVRRAPYGAAGTAATIGVFTGLMLNRRHQRRDQSG